MGSHQKYSCAVRMVSILAKRLPGIEMLPGAELDFLSFHLPPLFLRLYPSLPFFALLSVSLLSSLHPIWGMLDHVRGSRLRLSTPSGCLSVSLSVSRCVGRVCLLVFIFVSPVSLRVQTCFTPMHVTAPFWTLSQTVTNRVRKLCAAWD